MKTAGDTGDTCVFLMMTSGGPIAVHHILCIMSSYVYLLSLLRKRTNGRQERKWSVFPLHSYNVQVSKRFCSPLFESLALCNPLNVLNQLDLHPVGRVSGWRSGGGDRRLGWTRMQQKQPQLGQWITLWSCSGSWVRGRAHVCSVLCTLY